MTFAGSVQRKDGTRDCVPDGRVEEVTMRLAVKEETARRRCLSQAAEIRVAAERKMHVVKVKSRTSTVRLLWVAFGAFCVALGIVGIVLPLLPTTPFMILAAFCFARGSDRLHRWLMDHPRFGRAIRDWKQHGAIAPRTKTLAAAAMVAAVLLSIVAGFAWPIIAAQATAMAAAAGFVLTRPSPPG